MVARALVHPARHTHTPHSSTPRPAQFDPGTTTLSWTAPTALPTGVVGFRVLNLNGYDPLDVAVSGMVRGGGLAR